MYHVSLLGGAFLIIMFIIKRKSNLAVATAIVTFAFMILYSQSEEMKRQEVLVASDITLVEGE